MVNVNDGRLCKGRESFTSAATFNFFFHLLILPVFFTVFWRVFAHLLSQPRSPMIAASITYVLLGAAFQLFGFYNYVGRDLLANSTLVPIPVCATIEWFNWMFAGAAFLVFQQVFVQRLAAVFARSSFAVKPWVIKLWGVVHISAMIYAMGMLSIRSTVTKCYTKVKLTGFLVDAGVFPQKSYACDFPEKDEYIEKAVLAVTAMIALFGNGALTWMYTRRLYLVFSPNAGARANRRQAAKNRKTMRKTTIVALSSFITDLIAFIMSTWDIMYAMYLDSLLNVFFLFCLFKAGEQWYNATLRRLEWIVDWVFADALRKAIELARVPSIGSATTGERLPPPDFSSGGPSVGSATDRPHSDLSGTQQTELAVASVPSTGPSFGSANSGERGPVSVSRSGKPSVSH